MVREAKAATQREREENAMTLDFHNSCQFVPVCSHEGRSAHLILAMALSNTALILRIVLVINRDIQIPPVVNIGPAAQLPRHRLAGLDGQDVGKVEDGLLPVRVLCVRARGEADGLVAGGELDVEPGDEGVDVVGAAHGQLEGEGEGEVVGRDGVEVEGQNGAGVGHDGFQLDGVDEGFCEGGDFERGVVEAVDVVPDCESSC